MYFKKTKLHLDPDRDQGVLAQKSKMTEKVRTKKNFFRNTQRSSWSKMYLSKLVQLNQYLSTDWISVLFSVEPNLSIKTNLGQTYPTYVDCMYQ